MGLRLHPSKQTLHDTWRSVEFLGAVIRPYQRYCSRRTVRSYACRLAVWRHNEFFSDEAIHEHVRSVRDSYRGYFGHFRSVCLVSRLERRCPPLFCVHNTITMNPSCFTINNTMQ